MKKVQILQLQGISDCLQEPAKEKSNWTSAMQKNNGLKRYWSFSALNHPQTSKDKIPYWPKILSDKVCTKLNSTAEAQLYSITVQ